MPIKRGVERLMTELAAPDGHHLRGDAAIIPLEMGAIGRLNPVPGL